MKIENLVFCLGADDPEMSAIEKMLQYSSVRYFYAAVGDKRVRPDNMYKADRIIKSPSGTVNVNEEDTVVFVECQFIQQIHVNEVFVDHHREGDVGYGRPPEDFFQASSIGQVWEMLYPKNGEVVLEVPGHLKMVAAADHCLAAAYQGRCPGVHPDDLLKFRIEQRAAFQKKSVEELEDATEKTRIHLWQLKEEYITRVIDSEMPANTINSIVLDLTSEPSGSLPEAPEAACREGLAVMAKVMGPDKREKLVVLGNTTPQVIEAWMKEQKDLGREVYGDPQRGFAGSYL